MTGSPVVVVTGRYGVLLGLMTTAQNRRRTLAAPPGPPPPPPPPAADGAVPSALSVSTTTWSPSARPSRISVVVPSVRPVWTVTGWGVLPRRAHTVFASALASAFASSALPSGGSLSWALALPSPRALRCPRPAPGAPPSGELLATT